MKYTHYVLGFLFDQDDQHVLLIRKQRPAWARGLLNGIGGVWEEEEPLGEAMTREFKEETGLFLEQWREFGLMTGPGWEVHLFESQVPLDLLDKAQTVTDEEVVMMPLNAALSQRDSLVESVPWLLLLAIDRSKTYTNIFRT